MKTKNLKLKTQNFLKGQATLVAMIFFLLIFLAFVFGFSFLAIPEGRIASINLNAKQSYFLAEAGAEDVLYRMMKAMDYSATEVLTINGSSATTNVNDMGGGEKEITSQADVSGAIRKVRVNVKEGVGVSFTYGVQVGDAGLTMGNGTSIVGNIFSNGNIQGGGVSQSTITGTAQIAGNNRIEDVAVNENAYAGIFQDCQIGSIAHYVTSITNCPAASTQILSPPLTPENFPISQGQIDAWKAEAEAGGTLTGYTLGNNTSASLGPKKINGNITLGNNVILTLTGTVWVTGTVNLGNSDTIKLDTGYGTKSGMLIVDGAVNLGNTVVLSGSGQAGSYIMILSLFGPGSAIDIGNSASSAILYAPNGTIAVGNNLALRQATAYGLTIGNNSSVTYESGLANALFISGPTGSFVIESWKEIE